PLGDVTARPQRPPGTPGPATPRAGTRYVRRRGWIQDRTRPGQQRRSSRATATPPVRTAGAAGAVVRLPAGGAAAAVPAAAVPRRQRRRGRQPVARPERGTPRAPRRCPRWRLRRTRRARVLR